MNLETATPAQREAITTDAATVLCVAGPGAGKTATTVARIEYRIADRTHPEQICCLTFTNAAANELQRRLGDERKLGFVGTLHSFALRMLKEYGEPFGYGDRVALISPESAQDLIESIARTVGCKTPMKDLLALKQKGRPERTVRLDLPATVLATYFDDLKAAGVVDYDVLLTEFLAILEENSFDSTEVQRKIGERFAELYVDEVQDSSPIDWRIYKALPIARKFLVGDSDQAVYSFRGGSVEEMLAFSMGDDPGADAVITLEENFRSRSEICDAANRLIGHNAGRIKKETRSVSGSGGKVYVAPPCSNPGEEIGAVARKIREVQDWDNSRYNMDPKFSPVSIAVLARTNDIAHGFRTTLAATGIAVVERSVKPLPLDWRLARAFVEFICTPENDALAFLYLVALYEKKGANPKEARTAAHAVRKAAAAACKTINAANLGFGRITRPESVLAALASQPVSREAQAIAVERFQELPAGATVLDLALSLAEVREHVKEGEGDGVNVLTIHGAKGREFDVVFLVGFEDECCPGRAAKVGPEAIEEERRLAYVAVTRARRELYISHCESRVTAWGQIAKRTPSRFIAELAAPAV